MITNKHVLDDAVENYLVSGNQDGRQVMEVIIKYQQCLTILNAYFKEHVGDTQSTIECTCSMCSAVTDIARELDK